MIFFFFFSIPARQYSSPPSLSLSYVHTVVNVCSPAICKDNTCRCSCFHASCILIVQAAELLLHFRTSMHFAHIGFLQHFIVKNTCGDIIFTPSAWGCKGRMPTQHHRWRSPVLVFHPQESAGWSLHGNDSLLVQLKWRSLLVLDITECTH